MIVKLLIFICSVYVVKGYVVINVLDDDADSQVTSRMDLGQSPAISECSPLGCAQLCRRLGLKGGVCVHGKCKCDLFIESEDADSQVTPRMDLDESPAISECSPLGCAQLCRRIGLKGGVCVHGKCKCDLFIDSKASDTDDTQTSLTQCDSSRCDHGCRSIGYPGGHCYGSECRCDPRSEKDYVENADVADTDDTQTSLKRCDSSRCYRGCRSIGYPGGHCVGCECRCYPRSESNHVENVDDDTQTPLAGCDSSRCYSGCRSIGYPGGHCVGSECRCYPRSESNHLENVDDDTQTPLAGCDSSRCNRGCRSIGYPGGHCVGSECRCYPRSESSHVENVDDDTKTTLEKCHSSECLPKCHSLGFAGGFCMAKRCICIPRYTKSEDSNLIISSDGDVQEMKLENPSPMLTECNIGACEQLCSRISLKGGSCVNGKCKCDIIKESNEIPVKKNEDKDEETAMDDDQSLVGSCSTSQCIHMCRGIGYNGGMCDYRDACKCF